MSLCYYTQNDHKSIFVASKLSAVKFSQYGGGGGGREEVEPSPCSLLGYRPIINGQVQIIDVINPRYKANIPAQNLNQQVLNLTLKYSLEASIDFVSTVNTKRPLSIEILCPH